MSVNLYNAERYLDPTAYEALMNIEREAKRTAYKPLVFICSPFAGNIERNTRRARDFCRFAVSENCMAAHGSGFVTAISQPTHCASNASGPVKSPLPKKSTISCRCPRAAPMWKVTSWPYASGAILRSPPARVAGGAEILLRNKANRACNHPLVW